LAIITSTSSHRGKITRKLTIMVVMHIGSVHSWSYNCLSISKLKQKQCT
jgi:hypothetical protein